MQSRDCNPDIAIGLQGGLMVGEVCGAVSGAVLALGLLYGEEDPEIVTYQTEEFVHTFSEMNGAVRCEDIIGFNFGSMDKTTDINSLKGLLKFGLRGGKKMCKGIVSSSVEIIIDQIEEWEK